MNKFICVGAIVKRGNRIGEVITIEPKTRIAIMQNEKSFWCENINNLKLVSYEGVQ